MIGRRETGLLGVASLGGLGKRRGATTWPCTPSGWGFRDLVTHPVLDAVCRQVLGEDYQYVEVGFDVALPGAVRQPLHRDFPTPQETLATGRLSSLALNATCVDVTPEMGPL